MFDTDNNDGRCVFTFVCWNFLLIAQLLIIVVTTTTKECVVVVASALLLLQIRVVVVSSRCQCHYVPDSLDAFSTV